MEDEEAVEEPPYQNLDARPRMTLQAGFHKPALHFHLCKPNNSVLEGCICDSNMGSHQS